MKYVMSDIHGQDDLFFKMLKEINFSKEDTLYILGDVVSRGPGSIKILLYIMENDNAIMLKGNHEAFLIDYHKKNKFYFNPEHPWMDYGGLETYNELRNFSNASEIFNKIAAYVSTLPLFKHIQVGDKTFVLVHSELFLQDGLIYPYQDEKTILWGNMKRARPIILKENLFIISGHLRANTLNEDGSNNVFLNIHGFLLTAAVDLKVDGSTA